MRMLACECCLVGSKRELFGIHNAFEFFVVLFRCCLHSGMIDILVVV